MVTYLIDWNTGRGDGYVLDTAFRYGFQEDISKWDTSLMSQT